MARKIIQSAAIELKAACDEQATKIIALEEWQRRSRENSAVLESMIRERDRETERLRARLGRIREALDMTNYLGPDAKEA